MGTSKSNDGPSGGSPLLPPWAPPLQPYPPPGDGNGNVNDRGSDAAPEGHGGATAPDLGERPSWQTVKTQTTKLASGGSTGGALRTRARSAARNYVRARGGARQAAQGSVAGRRTAVRIGGFLAGVARGGIAEALRVANMGGFIGRSVEDLLAAFADVFLPPPSTLDEAAARDAGLMAFYELLLQYDVVDGDLEALNRLDADGITTALEHFFSRYISSSALVMLSKRIEDGSISIDRCEQIEHTLREVIKETVRLNFRDADVVNMDWNSTEAHGLIDTLIVDAYALIEAL